MAWTLTATGTAPSPEEERVLVVRLRSMLRNPRLGVQAATLDTAQYGTVDLLSIQMPVPPPEGPAAP